MALTIEDGSVVPGADSFALASELVTYAANFGRTIPATEGAQESLLRRAYLQMIALPWKGGAVSPDQTGAVTKERVEGAVEVQYSPASARASKPAATRQSYAQFAGFLESSSQVQLVRG